MYHKVAPDKCRTLTSLLCHILAHIRAYLRCYDKKNAYGLRVLCSNAFKLIVVSTERVSREVGRVDGFWHTGHAIVIGLLLVRY
jgi:hypothetical protein